MLSRTPASVIFGRHVDSALFFTKKATVHFEVFGVRLFQSSV